MACLYFYVAGVGLILVMLLEYYFSFVNCLGSQFIAVILPKIFWN